MKYIIKEENTGMYYRDYTDKIPRCMPDVLVTHKETATHFTDPDLAMSKIKLLNAFFEGNFILDIL
jgi:hypothetical protein